MIYYNHARKVMFLPFPFPHAQLSVLFVMLVIPAVAVLMDQFAKELIMSSSLAFLTVTCLSGIHEVARELENPFRNIPNELPLVNLQAQFNESLITMYAGYHPDHFWEKQAKDYDFDEPSVDAPSESERPVTPDQPSPEALVKLMQQQKLAMELRMQQMAEQQKLESERQQREIDSLKNQLLRASTEEKKMEHSVRPPTK